MKKQYTKWLDLASLAAYAVSVFVIAGGHFWPGIALFGAGTSLFSAAAIHKKTLHLKKNSNEMGELRMRSCNGSKSRLH